MMVTLATTDDDDLTFFIATVALLKAMEIMNYVPFMAKRIGTVWRFPSLNNIFILFTTLLK